MIAPRIFVGAIALVLVSGSAFAQGAPAAGGAPGRGPQPPPARGPEMMLAVEAAQTAVNTCTANGYKVGATVLDSGGVVRVVIAADGAAKGAIESGGRKANATLAFKMASSDIQEKMKTDQAMAAKISADPTMMGRAGALPLMVGGDLVGVIGVGGAPGGDKDEACAKAGLDKIRARLK